MVTNQRPRTGERHGVTPLESTRRGAHRARPGALAAALPLLAVAGVVLIAVIALFQILDDNGAPAEEPKNVQAGQDTGPAPSPSPSASPSAGQPSTSEQPAQGAPGVDKSVRINVLNNTSINGLGKRAAGKLKDVGWTDTKVGNLLPRNSLEATTVFYATDDQEATARAVVEALGLGSTVQSQSQAKDGITLALAKDFDAASR